VKELPILFAKNFDKNILKIGTLNQSSCRKNCSEIEWSLKFTSNWQFKKYIIVKHVLPRVYWKPLPHFWRGGLQKRSTDELRSSKIENIFFFKATFFASAVSNRFGKIKKRFKHLQNRLNRSRPRR
jgi:hypothetical protein